MILYSWAQEEKPLLPDEVVVVTFLILSVGDMLVQRLRLVAVVGHMP